MAEQVNLANPDISGPIPPQPASTSYYKISKIHIDIDNGVIEIQLRGENNLQKYVRYDNVKPLINQLNTIDLSVKSFHKRLFEKLIADNHLDGTITESPTNELRPRTNKFRHTPKERSFR